MALRKIIYEGDPALRKRCHPVTAFTKRTADLMDDLKETLVQAEGAGLAAPQVGILRRACVILRDDEMVEMINPEIIKQSDEEEGLFEGCLSCPDKRGYLMRPKEVTVRAQNRNGEWFEIECCEIAARAACHEIDHLDGVLFVDKVDHVYTEAELDELLAQIEEDSEDGEAEKEKS